MKAAKVKWGDRTKIEVGSGLDLDLDLDLDLGVGVGVGVGFRLVNVKSDIRNAK